MTVNYQPKASGEDHCEECKFFAAGICTNPIVRKDPEVPNGPGDTKLVSAQGWCNQFTELVEVVTNRGGAGSDIPTGDLDGPREKKANMRTTLKKFVPFAKVDESTRQVWGIVTAELPDKDNEVCDYVKTKPFYQAVIAEMSKATDGKNFFPLREMHSLTAIGKCIGFEFRDKDKEIFMGFKVVDDDAWALVQENVYTGFSQGGRIMGDMEPDPIFKGCMRYTANPSECSLVDNPCLAAAHFAYVKSDGRLEMRKYGKVETLGTGGVARLQQLEREVELIKASIPFKKAKTKRVAGEDLPASAFAHVGDPEDTSTWKLPIKFSSDSKSKRHIRNALARFNQTKDIPAAEKDKVHAHLVAAAKEHGIDVGADKEKLAAIHAHLRKQSRSRVNKLARVNGGDVTHSMSFLDDHLGYIAKGMYEVSALARMTEELGYLVFAVSMEQEWEQDSESGLPDMLADNVGNLLDTFLAMAQEEAAELREAVDGVV